MVNKVKLDVLAVAAHPDDAEITCGGLLIKMAIMGRAAGVLDLSRGEMGTHGDQDDRAREAANAAKIMGLAWRGNGDIADSAVENNRENRLKVAQVIRDTQPEMLILPHWEQRHPDHRICSQLGFDAAFMAGLEKAELEGEPCRPRKIIYVSYFRNTDYSFMVDISEQFDRKIEAVAAYESQFGSSSSLKEALKSGLNLYDVYKTRGKNIFAPGIGIADLLQTRHRQLGQMCGVRYAEAYTIKETILIDDPQTMPVRSI